MKKYCFCFDIDGTLLPGNHKISISTIQAIKNLQQKGHKVMIATGRNYRSVLGTHLLDDIKWDGLVLNNGQCILNEKYDVIYVEAFDDKTVRSIIEVTQKEGLVCSLEKVFEWFTIQPPNEDVRITHEFFHEVMPSQGKYEKDMEIVMAIAYAPKGYNYEPYRSIEGITVNPGNSHYADLVKKGCHKYKGIEKCLKYFDIYDTVCFGDGSNDLDMIQNATIGIAMGQGIDELKKCADFVTKSCDEDGIVYALKHFGFIE